MILSHKNDSVQSLPEFQLFSSTVSLKKALCLFCKNNKAEEDQKDFDRRLMELKQELVSGERKAEHEKLYTKYFDVKSTPVRCVRVTVEGKMR